MPNLTISTSTTPGPTPSATPQPRTVRTRPSLSSISSTSSSFAAPRSLSFPHLVVPPSPALSPALARPSSSANANATRVLARNLHGNRTARSRLARALREVEWARERKAIGGSWVPRTEVRVVMGNGLPGSLVRGRSVREILGGVDDEDVGMDADVDVDADGDDEGDGDAVAEEERKVKRRERRGREQIQGGDGRTWFQLRPEIPGSELVDWEDLAEILGDAEEEVSSNSHMEHELEHKPEPSIAISTSGNLPTTSEAETEDGMDVEQTQLLDTPLPGSEPKQAGPSVSASAPLTLSRQQTVLPISASFRQAKTEYQHKHPNPNAPFSISTKEVVLKRLFPKYEPYVEGLPAGRIYLRHEVDRFEFRALEGWGCESYSTETTDDGKGKGKAKGKGKERLLQWSFTRGTWMFVMDELPSQDRPRKVGGYSIPDRGDVLGLGASTKIRKEGKPTASFLAQGLVVVPKDSEIVVRQFPECAVPPSAVENKDDNEDEVKGRDGNEDERDEQPSVKSWEWIMPVKESLWVPPMHEIVRKFGEGARPVWDLGGRMLWDVVRGQWMFVVCDALGEMEELVDRPPVVRERDGTDDMMRVVEEGATPIGKARQIYDVCVGGRARVEWDAFHRAREYLVRPGCHTQATLSYWANRDFSWRCPRR